MTTARGHQLVRTLCRGEARGDEAHELLEEVWSGFPIDGLCPLFSAESEQGRRAAAWIGSELASRAEDLVPELPRLFSDSSDAVRFYAIETVMLAAKEEHAAVIALALDQVDSNNSGARDATLAALSWMRPDLLLAALAGLCEHKKRLVEWLASEGSKPSNSGAIVEMLGSASWLERAFATAAAVRIAYERRGPLEAAAELDDEGLGAFARDQLRTQLWTRLGGPGQGI